MWGLDIRRSLLQAQSLALALTSTLMMYSALGLVMNCKSPIVVVLSGSMEPGIYRGDLLFLSNYEPRDYKLGDITVYQVEDEAAVSIVHRVVQTEVGESPLSFRILTKGDNNEVDDISLYRGLERLERKHVVGRVRGIIPYVGYVSILFNEYPRVKYTVFGLMALLNLA